MPETAVNKDDLSKAWEDNIRISWQRFDMKAIAVSHTVYQSANKHLRLGVYASYARHPVAAFTL